MIQSWLNSLPLIGASCEIEKKCCTDVVVDLKEGLKAETLSE